METTIENTIRSYLRVRATIQSATEELEALEENIKQTMFSNGLDKVTVDGKVLSLVKAERRTIDAKALKDLVSSSVFNKVTEPAVRTKLFDAAVSMGTIKKTIEEQVVQKTPYSQLRVN